MKKIYLIFITIIAFSISSYAEGTIQLITCGTCEAGMSINDKAQFAYPGLTEERRLHIRIGDFNTEDIYVALGQTQVGGAWYSRLVSPSGAFYVYDGTGFVIGGTPATLPVAITTAAENSAGPNGVTQEAAALPTVGSYDSETFTPTENGDWYIEFTDDSGFGIPTVSSRSPYWDISVVDNSTPDNNVINGRLWSKQWGLRSGPGSQTDPGDFLASTFYVYTEPDGVVTAIEVGDENDPGWGGDWLIACNSYGIDQAAYNNGDAAGARQSYDGDAAGDFGSLDEFKIFLNDPEINEFPSGVNQILFTSVAIDYCNLGSSYITFVTNVASVGDITLDFPPLNNGGAEDVVFPAQVIDAGANSIPWDGLDGLGNVVGAGTTFSISLFVGASTVHFPMYDVEGVTGMKARLVRPGAPGYIGLYWDNSLVPAGNPANPVTEIVNPGCVSSPSVACDAYGNSNNITLNMWWNGLETNLSDQVIMPDPANAALSAGFPTVCDSGGVVVILLSGSATNVNVVQWSSTGTGTFNNVNVLNPTYTPSAADIAAGSVTLSISSLACPNVSDDALVNTNNTTCVLPITLSSFLGSIDNCNVDLAWTTDSEELFSHFLLQKSVDGISFSTIKQIQSKGGENITARYTFTDKDQLAKRNYYRLGIVDLDGRIAYSDIIQITADCADGVYLSPVYPNPVRGLSKLRINNNFGASNAADIVITDVAGRQVRQYPVEILFGTSEIELNANGLSAGIYYVNLVAENWRSEHRKFVVH